MFRKKEHYHSSFSLVEMVIILGVIGILLSLALKGLAHLREASWKVKAGAHLKTIATAYRQYMEDQGHPIRWKDLDAMKGSTSGSYDVTLIAAVLAKEGYLNAVDAWAWDFDYRVKEYRSGGKAMPVKICDIVRDGNGKVTSATVNVDFRGKNGFPVSVCAVVAGDAQANDDFFSNAGEIPIAYSRGLRSRTTNPGTWGDSKDNFDLGGIFGKKGGFIAFLDGRVEWFDNLGTEENGALKKYDTGERSNKIYAATPLNRGQSGWSIPSGSLHLAWKGGSQDCDFW
jgi:type II secretory pathway pseudopilin PulG